MREIKLNNGKIIKIRSPKVRDLKAVSHINDEIEKEENLIANLTGLSIEEIDEMDLSDYKKLQEALMGFLS